MNRKRRRTKNWLKRIGLALLLVIILICGGFYIYTLDYYRASDNVTTLMSEQSQRIYEENKWIVIDAMDPIDDQVGMIFYPGGKVEPSAYVPLLNQVAQQGVKVIIVKMPMNLAVFNINGANKVIEAYPEITQWFLAGHSLGGAMASSYVEKNEELLEGLILMGAYPINESKIDTKVLYGTYDVMLDLTKLEQVENVVEIKGGNHAYFGDYGEQEGDGTAIISREEQQKIATEEILKFIEEVRNQQ